MMTYLAIGSVLSKSFSRLSTLLSLFALNMLPPGGETRDPVDANNPTQTTNVKQVS